MAFTPFVTLLAFVGLGVCGLLRQWPAAVICAIAAGALIGAVAPRAIGGPDEDAEGRALRVMTANTLRGTAVFLSENLTEPVIKLNEYAVAIRRLVELVGLGRKR